MILVTGGLGFIGQHTVRALIDAGQPCVVTSYRGGRAPRLFGDDLGRTAFVEQVDVTDRTALAALGERYEIDGIVHLAAPGLLDADPFEGLAAGVRGLTNILWAAQVWKVRRTLSASTIGVYLGVEASPLREDLALRIGGTVPIETAKKTAEVIAGYAARHLGLEVASMRIGAAWGPLGRPSSRFFALPGLVHAAVAGESATAHALDAIDMCYVKDVGRAIAALMTAESLNHQTYNIGSGRSSDNRDVAAAIEKAVPGARIELLDGFSGPEGEFVLDISRLRADTGFEPAYDLERGIGDFVNWLRAENENPGEARESR
ncbi:MAG TPA: NAD(P)-dependent oxidoreductase [Actinocrinis sp.]|nr:NAD(P)-dependent oxidoreductase [Actinocrinis sp.]